MRLAIMLAGYGLIDLRMTGWNAGDPVADADRRHLGRAGLFRRANPWRAEVLAGGQPEEDLVGHGGGLDRGGSGRGLALCWRAWRAGG